MMLATLLKAPRSQELRYHDPSFEDNIESGYEEAIQDATHPLAAEVQQWR